MQQVIKKMTALLLSMLLCVVVLAGCTNSEVVEDNRPTGEYDWDYIASLLRADEVTPEEVDDLARLYSAMTPKDMERFFAAGYIPYSPEGGVADITSPTSVLSPLMAQVCHQFSAQADILALTLFDDGGVPHPGVTPEQEHEAQLQLLRAGIIQDVCTYGQEVYYNGTYGYNAAYGPVSITQFGVNEELRGIYTYNVTLRHYEPYINSHDDMHQWASRSMGTGIITSRQAEYYIWREQTVGYLNELKKMLPIFRQSEYNKSRAREYETAHHITRGLEVLGAFVRMGYNITTMQMEIRYITYDESEAYLRYRAFIEQLPQGADKPSMAEFVQALQSGGGDPDSDQYKIFVDIMRWYGTNPNVELNELRNAYEAALEHAKIARPDVKWPEDLGGCTQEQMTHLIFYM